MRRRRSAGLVLVDARVERLELRHRVVRGVDESPSSRPRAVGATSATETSPESASTERQALEAGADHGDRVAPVVRLVAALGQAEDDGRALPGHRVGSSGGDQHRSDGKPAPKGVRTVRARGLRGGLLADPRAGTGHEQPDGRSLLERFEVGELEAGDDQNAKRLRLGAGLAGKQRQRRRDEHGSLGEGPDACSHIRFRGYRSRDLGRHDSRSPLDGPRPARGRRRRR